MTSTFQPIGYFVALSTMRNGYYNSLYQQDNRITSLECSELHTGEKLVAYCQSISYSYTPQDVNKENIIDLFVQPE